MRNTPVDNPVQATVDLRGLGPGTYPLAAVIQLPGGLEIVGHGGRSSGVSSEGARLADLTRPCTAPAASRFSQPELPRSGRQFWR